MIANSLSRDSPPATPLRQRPHTSKISVTVSNKLAATKAGREGDGSRRKRHQTLLFSFLFPIKHTPWSNFNLNFTGYQLDRR